LRDDGALKVSRGIKERSVAIKTVRNHLTNALGREPTLRELSEKTGFSIEDIAMVESATAGVESIHQVSGEDGFTLESVLTDTQSEETFLEKIALKQAVDRLPEREAMVVKLRYFHGLTQQRVSKILDVSQVQVSRIEKRALEKLREFMI
jgi:RNA polymerase sporulation-specific sigma factor